ncbi:Mce family protein MceA [Nocardia nova SH22a]|uniref:Mce family protein MceA n=1 Tax=Nocardia nova SH22a TaxID=1415166 RepID=W5TQF8_9NOCA|nr:MCE family protein [Nocardia nova]AHH19471.1 Mce family protein MceA [Nocardia nova SH22a]
MPIAFESDGRRLSDTRLAVRGLIFLVVAGLAVAAMLARSQGWFERTVPVIAELADVGDGLPAKSDVKFHGVLVGTVDGVEPSRGDGPHRVRLSLLPGRVGGIPATVTARVVPSNVFAVPSVQLVDNGPAPALRAGARLPQDRSLPTVRLQTSLTALDRIAAAAGRSGADPMLGILTTVERATSGRGDAAVRAAGQLNRIVQALDGAMTPDGTVATLDSLARAVTEWQSAAPDLLDALHNAVLPLRTVAQQRAGIAELLGSAITTSGTVDSALAHHGDQVRAITANMGPVLDVLAEGGRNFPRMTTSVTRVDQRFLAEFWDPQAHNGTAKIILELAPHQQYTRADCPRYGTLEGPSCHTAPVNGPSVLDRPGTATPAAQTTGGEPERQQVAAIVGSAPNPLADLLIGPLVRGNDVTVTREPGGAR